MKMLALLSVCGAVALKIGVVYLLVACQYWSIPAQVGSIAVAFVTNFGSWFLAFLAFAFWIIRPAAMRAAL